MLHFCAKMKVLVVQILLIGLVSAAFARKTRFDGHKVYRVTPKTHEHVKVLIELESNNLEVSFWEESSFVGKPADIMFPPHLQGDLIDTLKAQGLEVSLFIADVQALIDAEVVSDVSKAPRLSFDSYHRYSVIQSFLDEQVTLHSNAQIAKIGKTYEMRDLDGIVIGAGPSKPVIFLEAGIHAREWIAGAVATYVINELLNSADPVVKKWAEDYEWHIVPIANPDGFEYSHTNNRLWRKSRSEAPAPSTCFGADMNRNWAYKWGTGGSSPDPCNDTYMGSAPFSEVENKALSEYITTISDRLVFYLDLHSYSQLILLPYGVVEELPEKAEWMQIGNRASRALAARYGTQFTVGNIVDLLYPASGGSIDWVKGTYDTKLVLVYELRDKGSFGFLLPANQILPSCLEFMDSLKSIMRDLAEM